MGITKGWAGIEIPEVSHCRSSLSGDDAAVRHAASVGECLLSLAHACAMCEGTSKNLSNVVLAPLFRSEDYHHCVKAHTESVECGARAVAHEC